MMQTYNKYINIGPYGDIVGLEDKFGYRPPLHVLHRKIVSEIPSRKSMALRLNGELEYRTMDVYVAYKDDNDDIALTCYETDNPNVKSFMPGYVTLELALVSDAIFLDREFVLRDDFTINHPKYSDRVCDACDRDLLRQSRRGTWSDEELEELYEEAYGPTIFPRRRNEILAAAEYLSNTLWYNHVYLPAKTEFDAGKLADSLRWQEMSIQASDLERFAGSKCLIIADEQQEREILGKLSALRWAFGDDWDEYQDMFEDYQADVSIDPDRMRRRLTTIYGQFSKCVSLSEKLRIPPVY
ncbi:hypothetical protein IHQ71_31380 (plasmid) [Rhizobium sp. TH2]|uniref:hypothetical protein n=1 Tax=Rhizobium sp. TH2 TaxID=2775403 RepID=UPI0021585C30|nr:hypothetical protein [Rhizobium sp. TH2]UVC12668.1 hypothetical protein IHQ71_31380 [Rhizobium sp. TH2]